MSTVFSENGKRDIFLGPNKQIAVGSGLGALIQSAKSSIEIQAGEAIFATGNGIPTEQTAWGGSPNLQQFEFYARKQLLKVSGVTEVSLFEASIDADVLSYQATIKTIYGGTVINGSV